jgi:ribose 1,5-bisphosphokinase
MAGGFVLVVGPSGAGKDTLIGLAKAALAEDPGFVFPRRLVTRPKGPWEDHDTISMDTFETEEHAGSFALSWRAHGLGYAIPARCLDDARAGRVVVCNVSRSVVEAARRRLPGACVVEVTAPHEILAQRLATRRRPEDGDLGKRLARAAAPEPFHADLIIVNDGAPESGAAQLTGLLRRQRALSLS